jgi:hypothetical protein
MVTGRLIVFVLCGLIALELSARAEELPGIEGPDDLGVRVPLLVTSTFLTAVNTIDFAAGHHSRFLGTLGVLSGVGTIWAEVTATDPEAWVMGVGVAAMFTGVLNFMESEPEIDAGVSVFRNLVPLVSIGAGSTVYVGASAKLPF